MQSTQRCPISGERVDESVGRIYGVGVFLVLVSSMVFYAPWLLVPLMIDFAVRLVVGLKASPGARVAMLVAKALRMPERPHDAAPKKFAAALAFSFTTLAIISALVYMSTTAFYVFAGIFAICAGLEGFFGLCIGCRVYGLLPRRLVEPGVHREVA